MEPYKIYDFEDEKAWLKGRLNGIGGSDASAVVGKNPYKTNIELFEEKTGRRFAPDISEKPYVIYGKEAEQFILIDDDILREEAPTMGYFAMFEYENGFRKTLYWSKKKMLAHAEKYSFAFYKNGGARSLELLEQGKIPEKDMWKYSSFWFKDFDGMALKTMLRQLISKWGIMSIDLQNAIDKDMAVIHEDGKTDYVDAAKAEDDGVVSDQELQEVQEDQPAAPGTQQPDPKGIEASFFG